MRIFLDNKGVSTLWSQFKAKLAVHANNSDIHVTAEEKATWDGKAELSDIPTTLPANGGNATTVNGKTVEMSVYRSISSLGVSSSDTADTVWKAIPPNSIFAIEALTFTDPSWNFPEGTNQYSLLMIKLSNVRPLGMYLYPKSGGNVFFANVDVNGAYAGNWRRLCDGGDAETVGGYSSNHILKYIASIPSNDCNDFTEAGWHLFNGCGGHAPGSNSTIASGTYFILLNVQGSAPGYFVQVATFIHGATNYLGKTYIRYCNNNEWTEWGNIADGGNAATVNGYTVNANVPAGFSPIGQNTENKTYTYGRVTYTGSNTSEVFNSYTDNMAANEYSHAEGYDTKALGDHSHAEGSGTKALGFHSHAECSSTEASGDCSHAEGMDTTASGECSHAEGSMTTASSSASHAEGSDTRASGNDSHAEGSSTKASGSHSHAEGSLTEASGESSHAEGLMTGASSSASHAEGYGTIASSFASHAGGKYSKAMTNSTGETDNTGDAFVIGNGTEAYTLSNAFRVTYGGAVYGLSAFNSSGADYAEFIKPWADGNPDNEDRVGYMVTIKNGLLHKANDGDYIVGITSGNPSVVGNADEDYYWRYARDEFNRFVYEDAEEEVEQLDDDGAPVLDENGMPVMVKTGNIIKNAHYKLAADYDPTKQNDYIERKNRPEWSYVGMIGVIPVRDDGTCEAGCFCKCSQNGIATRAESRGFDTFFVIERLSDNVVSVEIK